jgi:glucose-6-phosphate 1-epimerase
MLNSSVFCKIVHQGQLPCLHITHPKFFAEICLQGAQLTRFSPTQGPDLIWLSQSADYIKGQGLRGGIPICWPWFGSLAKNPTCIKNQVEAETFNYETLAHGFVRKLDWQLTAYAESVHGVELSLTIKHSEESLKIWPFEFSLTCHFILSDDIEIQLETTNLSKQDMHFSQALHSYFPTDNIHKTRILGTEQQRYVDTLDNWCVKTQQQPVSVKEEVDRIYFGKANYTILMPRDVITVSSNSSSTVIWNPWINKSKRLSQFGPNDYESMLCIESANVLDDSVSLASDASHTLSLTIR